MTLSQDGADNIMPSTAASLKALCVKCPGIDPELVLDVYLIVANHGKPSYLPDEDLMKDIAQTDPRFWDLQSNIAQRKEFLERFAKSRYMQALIKLNDAMKAAVIFVDHLQKSLEAKIRATKSTGPVDHNSGSTVNGYTTDDELDEIMKANEEYDPASALEQALADGQTYIDATQNQEVSAFLEGAMSDSDSPMMKSGCGPRGVVRTFTEEPGRNLANAVVAHGVHLPNKFPMIFEWYTKVLDELAMGKLIDKDVDEAKKKRDDQMQDLDRLSTIDPSEVAQETFDKKVADKTLIIKQDREEERGMNHVFVLLDVSGSMTGCDLGGRVCRAFAANVVTLALLNLAYKDKYKVWILPFEGFVGTIQSASNKTEALKVMQWLGAVNYDGGGTDIEGAVLKAYKLLQTDPTYNKADIVLITDGCSPISSRLKTEKPPNVKLRTIAIAEGIASDRHFKNLTKASDTWAIMTWDSMNNEFSVGNTLKGITSAKSEVALGNPVNEDDEE